MKALSMSTMTGAQALARALADARCNVMTHVPGLGATEIFEACRRRTRASTSYHEEVAYGVAHGAALCGVRSAVVMKTHGLAKAANAVLSSLSAGVTAALVVILADDRDGARSDNIFDAEALLRGLGLPFVTATAATVYDAVVDAVERGESTSLPQAVLIHGAEIEAATEGDPATRILQRPPSYVRDIARHLVCPLFTRYQWEVLERRRGGGSADDVKRSPLPRFPDDVRPEWRESLGKYVPFFDAMQSVPRDFTAGDTSLCSLFALPPYDAVDAVSYFGGSIPLAIGAWLSGRRNVWAVTGDFSFVAAGHLGMLEAAHRHASVKVVIFANGQAQVTGGQPVQRSDLEAVLAGYEAVVHRVPSPTHPAALRAAIDEALHLDGLRVIVLQYA